MAAAFNDPVEKLFRTAKPFKVWGQRAVEMHAVAPEWAFDGSPYIVYYGLENVSDTIVYNPQITVKDGENYTLQSQQVISENGSELQPGEIYWLECTLISHFPNEEPGEAYPLLLDKSFAVNVGGSDIVTHIWTCDLFAPLHAECRFLTPKK